MNNITLLQSLALGCPTSELPATIAKLCGLSSIEYGDGLVGNMELEHVPSEFAGLIESYRAMGKQRVYLEVGCRGGYGAVIAGLAIPSCERAILIQTDTDWKFTQKSYKAIAEGRAASTDLNRQISLEQYIGSLASYLKDQKAKFDVVLLGEDLNYQEIKAQIDMVLCFMPTDTGVLIVRGINNQANPGIMNAWNEVKAAVSGRTILEFCDAQYPKSGIGLVLLGEKM